jgi:hypothetical protein
VIDEMPAEFLLAGAPDDMRRVAERLRQVVRDVVPEAIERVRAGWGVIGYDVPVGRKPRFFLWIWAQNEHVHLGFQRGVLMADPERRLEGRGVTKLVRWLTFTPGEEIDPASIAPLILDCARIAGMSRDERALLEMERQARPD